jgi:tetratricopeptide (TPR) repeat protein
MSLINDYLKVVGERSPSSLTPGAVLPMLRKPKTAKPRPQWGRIAVGGILLLAFSAFFWGPKNDRNSIAAYDDVRAGVQRASAFPVRLSGNVGGASGSAEKDPILSIAQTAGSPLPVKTVQKAIDDAGAAAQTRSPALSRETSDKGVAPSRIVVTTSDQPRPANQPPPDINDLYQQGLLAQQAGKTQRAAKYYHEVLKQAPGHLDALTNLSAVYIAQGKLAAARQTLGTIRKIDSRNTKALVNLGFIEIREQRYPEAKAFFNQALSIIPSEETALVNLAYIAQVEHDPALAESYFKKIIDYYPGNIDAILNYASLMEQTSRYGTAISLYKQCLGQPGVKNNLELTVQIQNRVKLLSRYASRQVK